METITIDEKTLYNLTQPSEVIEELTHLNGNLTLVPNILSEEASLNKSVKEIEKIALEDTDKTSPKHVRGIRRKDYTKYRFLKGFKIMLKGREVIYKLEWISVELPVLYNKGRVKTQVEEMLLREEKVFKALMTVYSVLGGKLNAKLWMLEIQASGDFKYVIVDGKYVKLKGGRGSFSAIGVTEEGKRAVLDITLSVEKDVMSYWRLLVEVWKKYSFVLVVVDGTKALDKISLAELQVRRQGCLVHLKRNATKEEREALNVIFSAESGEIKPETCPRLLSYLSTPKELWRWLKSNNLIESFNSLLERRRFGSFHSPWRILQIARTIANNYNLSVVFHQFY